MTNITGAAQTAIDGYAAEMAKGSDPSATIYNIASSMAKFYLPGCTSFTLGTITPFPDEEFARTAIVQELDRFDKMRLGRDVRLDGLRIEPLSDLSAVCC